MIETFRDSNLSPEQEELEKMSEVFQYIGYVQGVHCPHSQRTQMHNMKSLTCFEVQLVFEGKEEFLVHLQWNFHLMTHQLKWDKEHIKGQIQLQITRLCTATQSKKRIRSSWCIIKNFLPKSKALVNPLAASFGVWPAIPFLVMVCTGTRGETSPGDRSWSLSG